MAFSVNRVTILGNVSRDPELRYTPNGTAVCVLDVATNRSIKDGNGGYKDVPSFHRLTVWGKIAEFVGGNVYKGDKVYCEGRLEYRSYDNKQGQKVYVTDVVAETVIPMAKKGESRPYNPEAQAVEDSGLMEPPEGQEAGAENVDPDDIPF